MNDLGKRTAVIGIAVLALAGSGRVSGQDYPNRPITFVVANAGGTPSDNVARFFATEMAKVLGQPIVVENKPGANQVIGLEHVARLAPADGYTFISAFQTAVVTLPVVVKDLRFNPTKDLIPVAGLATERLALWSSAKQPWSNFGEFVQHAKSSPGKLNYGSPSAATRLTMEALLKSPTLSLDVVHIPYKGSAPSFQALLAGEVHVGLGALQAAVASGDKIRLLAVTGETRSPKLPDVPTFKELGFGHVQGVKHVLLARAGTPPRILENVYRAYTTVMQRPEFRARLAATGLEPFADSSAEASAKNMADEQQMFADIAKRIGIQPE